MGTHLQVSLWLSLAVLAVTWALFSLWRTRRVLSRFQLGAIATEARVAPSPAGGEVASTTATP